MKIKNISRRMVVFQLEHDVVCSEGKCGCGEFAIPGTTRTVRTPDALTLCAGEEREIPAAVSLLREVKRAEARGEVTLSQESPTESTAPTETPTQEISAETQAVAGDRRQGRSRK